MNRDWLWDNKVSNRKVKTIFKNEAHPRFVHFSALLLSRKNVPKEVFKEYFSPKVFCRNWQRIKRRMRQDSWNSPRIEFWQAVYEVLKEKYKAEDISIRLTKPASFPAADIAGGIANKIIIRRKQKGLTQAQLAKKSGISQQMVSRIEKGRQNISIGTLKKIADKLDCDIQVELVEK